MKLAICLEMGKAACWLLERFPIVLSATVSTFWQTTTHSVGNYRHSCTLATNILQHTKQALQARRVKQVTRGECCLPSRNSRVCSRFQPTSLSQMQTCPNHYSSCNRQRPSWLLTFPSQLSSWSLVVLSRSFMTLDGDKVFHTVEFFLELRSYSKFPKCN